MLTAGGPTPGEGAHHAVDRARWNTSTEPPLKHSLSPSPAAAGHQLAWSEHHPGGSSGHCRLEQLTTTVQIDGHDSIASAARTIYGGGKSA